MRILRRKDVVAKTGLSFSTITRFEENGIFPKRIRLGKGSMGWVEDEIDRWIAARVAERDGISELQAGG